MTAMERPLSAEAVRNPKEARGKIRLLRELLNDMDRHCWAVGDLCSDLIYRHRVSLGYLAQKTGYQRSRLSELSTTARAFPPQYRNRGTFQDSLMARRTAPTMTALNMTPVQIRDEILKLKNKRPVHIRRHFINRMVAMQNNDALARSVRSHQPGQRVHNGCHHADYRDIIPSLPSHSVKLFIADPPYGGFKKKGRRGGYISSRSLTHGLRSTSDAIG